MCLALLAAWTLGACGRGEGTAAAVPATQPTAVLSGTVLYRERMPLRLDAVIKVRLLDVSLQDAPAMVLAEQEIPARGLAVPIAFALPYDPTTIDGRYSYAVRAEIRDGRNVLLWTTTTSHPVLTRGAPTDGVEIMLELVKR